MKNHHLKAPTERGNTKSYCQKIIGNAFIFFTLATLSNTSFAYGQNGHRITGCIAEQLIDKNTRTFLNNLLPVQSLARISTYPDEMRSNPSEFWQNEAGYFHYVTLSDDTGYQNSDRPENGDAYSALKNFTSALSSSNTSIEEKKLALSFIVHIIGDLHQPLHVGSEARNDRGGNSVKVLFFDKKTNLHSVWDTQLIEHKNLSFTEYCSWLLPEISEDDIQNWQSAPLEKWIIESAELREKIYPNDADLGYQYVYEFTGVSELRLKQAGVRIANYLNSLKLEWPE
ncbi:S1/P1 nuclease [Idiomarina aquatica]|uniref:S1/P1 nuclease n=1 Tax=Idiomarina aquatica TaxID=1327752 RepID=A0A4R6NWK4_9GAMM|nr:S1/P1 nuclease [Idiomarina aquatica]TDP26978.1 S1/P1 nuclease [Idiomarina aquatica]